MLKVTGIIRPDEDVTAPMLTGTIGYTGKLTEYVINEMQDSDAIKAQLADSSVDIFTGLPFKESTGSFSDEEKADEWKTYVRGLNDVEKAQIYVQMKGIPSEEQLENMVSEAMGEMTRETMENAMLQAFTAQMSMGEEEVSEYLTGMSDEEMTDIFKQMLKEQMKAQYAAQVQEQMAAMQPAELTAALEMEIENLTSEQCAIYYDEIMAFSDNTYDGNMKKLGYLDLNDPATINIYASTFENKDVVEDAISIYNEDKDELSQITYTDYVGIMMSSVSTIINAITYVLIAFVAISLIVSSIMIGVITLISVQERTKEIGILRAIGASKRNVSSMFTAETVIIGFTSGLIGVVVTVLLCIPINKVIHNVTGIMNLDAYLPIEAAVILILISIILNFISGVIPSRSAAKKDPVVALRSE